MSITSHGFQPTLHCPCSWTSLRKPYLAPVNDQKNFWSWLMTLHKEALPLLPSASLCTGLGQHSKNKRATCSSLWFCTAARSCREVVVAGL